MENVRVGLITGRHPMPVDEYLINKVDNALLSADRMNDLRKLINTAVNEFSNNHKVEDGPIDLYLTGLSIVQHIAVQFLSDYGYIVRLFNYDRMADDYYCFMEII